MNTAVSLDEPMDSNENRNLRFLWSIVSAFLVTAIFAQAIFAGLMLSGTDWAREAHSVNAVVLIVSTIAAGLASLVTLRRVPQGPSFGFTLLSLALVVSLQTAIGKSSVQGANLMWIHVPLGVALVGFALRGFAIARRLGA